MTTTTSKPIRRRKKVRLKSVSRLLFFAFVILTFLALGITYYNQNKVSKQQAQTRASLETEIASLQQEKEDMARAIDAADSDESRARMAREELGYVQDGEIRFIAGENGESASEAPSATTAPQQTTTSEAQATPTPGTTDSNQGQSAPSETDPNTDPEN